MVGIVDHPNHGASAFVPSHHRQSNINEQAVEASNSATQQQRGRLPLGHERQGVVDDDSTRSEGFQLTVKNVQKALE